MNNEHSKQILYWSAITVLSCGALVGCEYCIPAMLALLVTTYVYRVTRTLTENSQTQQTA